MSEHHTSLSWQRDGGPFERGNYRREHQLRFERGQELLNSAAPGYGGAANATDPEELLLAAVSSCHMLTFLALCANRSYTLDSYADDAVAILDKNADGKFAVTHVTLNPRTRFSGDKIPNAEEIATLHERAHANCFIANSVKSAVEVRPQAD
ncbi:OsmC family protein [Tahibacter sp. UC22_41]|uniref:OsmC family protein n=1 Tax=Tahibacter sp. UC22_41 TaxID=3350178 RepID=UPI0036DD6374